MKKISLLTAFLCLLSLMAGAQPPKGDANPGEIYGQPVTPDNAVDITAVSGNVAAGDTLPVKVRARVLEVCKQKGCWMTLRVTDSTEAFVKMKEYGFFVPTSLSGKNVVLEGIAFIKTTSVAELKHYAEDAGKPKEEIEAITKPESQLRFLADGILVTE